MYEPLDFRFAYAVIKMFSPVNSGYPIFSLLFGVYKLAINIGEYILEMIRSL